MTAADPAEQAAFAPGTRAPQPGRREHWPGRRPFVWAPRARTVEVVLPRPDGAAERRPMRLVGAHEPGYWRADGKLRPGTDYAFSIDGGPPLPDPCSTSLPHGLQGPSRIADDDVAWHDDAWRGRDLSRGALLHLDVPTVTTEGTLDAAADLLPTIASLGVDGVELSPVSAFDPDAGPEAGVRLFAVHAPYGGPSALQRFVDAAHGAGLAVVLDLPHRWAVADSLGLHAFGPYATGSRIGPRAGSRRDRDTPRINLDGSGSRGPRDFLVADARRWLVDFHVDGLLLDVEALLDRSAMPFLGELAEAVQEVEALTGRPRTLLTDGPGLSDRLTSIVQRILSGQALAAPMNALRHLADQVFPIKPAMRPGSTLRRAHRAAARVSSVLVGDITRLPAAARAVPWSEPDDASSLDSPTTPGSGPAPDDVDDHAALLAFTTLVGTPLVLDTEHVPVQRTDADARRLVAWARQLLALRPASLRDIVEPVEMGTAREAFVARRGDTALVLVTAREPAEIDLAEHLPDPADGWHVAAAWDEATHLDAGRLRAPGRAVVVLRADGEHVGAEAKETS